MTVRTNTTFPFEQSGFPIYQITILVDGYVECAVLVEFVVDGFTVGVGGCFIEKEKNTITVPERFLPNHYFRKIYADLLSDDPKTCIVKRFKS